ncbi:hypothetical protein ABIB25_003018 [Nakamurella sp. UYEF19]|uniref:hypothetical protein n=1 Tax=Nakamurella sp. UYEF19 TaxID=1756392 RepID=UPI003390ADEA
MPEPVVRLWFLSEALRTTAAGARHDELEAALEMTKSLTGLDADQLDELTRGEMSAHCQAVQLLVGRTGA